MMGGKGERQPEARVQSNVIKCVLINIPSKAKMVNCAH